jgi:hypothetical protein
MKALFRFNHNPEASLLVFRQNLAARLTLPDFHNRTEKHHWSLGPGQKLGLIWSFDSSCKHDNWWVGAAVSFASSSFSVKKTSNAQLKTKHGKTPDFFLLVSTK